MLFSDKIPSGYSLRCIRVSTCTYMCACVTVFLTLVTGWSITAHTCMHDRWSNVSHMHMVCCCSILVTYVLFPRLETQKQSF